MLAHIDFVNAAISDLDTSLAAAVEPSRPVLKRLTTIPGVSDARPSCCSRSAART